MYLTLGPKVWHHADMIGQERQVKIVRMEIIIIPCTPYLVVPKVPHDKLYLDLREGAILIRSNPPDLDPT